MARRPEKSPIPIPRAGRLIEAARACADGALGQLLNAYRPFLLALAAAEFDSDLKAKAGPSDLVQETFIEPSATSPISRPTAKTELRIWLHAILMNRPGRLAQAIPRAPRNGKCGASDRWL